MNIDSDTWVKQSYKSNLWSSANDILGMLCVGLVHWWGGESGFSGNSTNFKWLYLWAPDELDKKGAQFRTFQEQAFSTPCWPTETDISPKSYSCLKIVSKSQNSYSKSKKSDDFVWNQFNPFAKLIKILKNSRILFWLFRETWKHSELVLWNISSLLNF